jgi:heme A synthase
MRTLYSEDAPPVTVLGPCPGCDAWQLEYGADVTPAEVEAVLREHANECPPLLAMAIRQVMSAGL